MSINNPNIPHFLIFYPSSFLSFKKQKKKEMETSFVKNENDFQKLKILITGGNGFLAGRFAKYFHNLYDFILLGRQELDVRDEKKTMELFQFHKPQIVIHSAAVANTLTCENEPQFSYDVNVKGSLNVGKACLAIKAKLLFLSTEQIFNSKTTRGPHKVTIFFYFVFFLKNF